MKKNQAGQSTIEFIFAFAFGVSLVLVVFNSSMNHISGYLAHYATFMASRTYLTYDSNVGNFDAGASLNRSIQESTDVFVSYNLGFFNIPNSSFSINPANAGDIANYYKVGATTSFEKDIDILGKVMGHKKINMISESFLGKEPTRNMCAIRVCQAITGQPTCSIEMDITLFDDGC